MNALIEITVRGVAQGALYTLLGLGFVVIYKATNVVNFAIPALMMLGALLTSQLVGLAGLSFWVALPIAAAIAGLVGAATERLTMRRMIGEPAFSAAMVTVGVFIVLMVVINHFIGVQPRQVGDPWGLQTMRLGAVTIYAVDLARILCAVVTVAALSAFFRRTITGLAMRATAADQEVAAAQGVPVHRMFSLAWALAGVLAATAGVFLSAGGSGGFDTNTALIALKALPAIVLGGLDSTNGAIVGGLMIGLAEAYSRTYQPDLAPWLGANFEQVVPYVLMLLVLLVRPHGLFGTKEIERP